MHRGPASPSDCSASKRCASERRPHLRSWGKKSGSPYTRLLPGSARKSLPALRKSRRSPAWLFPCSHYLDRCLAGPAESGAPHRNGLFRGPSDSFHKGFCRARHHPLESPPQLSYFHLRSTRTPSKEAVLRRTTLESSNPPKFRPTIADRPQIARPVPSVSSQRQPGQGLQKSV